MEKVRWIVVDVEADGPCPGIYSMVKLGAVVVNPHLDLTFYAEMAPITETYDPNALSACGLSRAQTMQFDRAVHGMESFRRWIQDTCADKKPVFVSDNPAFDWQFVNYYFHYFQGANPFGHSARRIGDIFAGMKFDSRAQWKQLRKTRHDHNPVNDAKGNVEALLAMQGMGMRLPIGS